jgi:hypothetical protein
MKNSGFQFIDSFGLCLGEWAMPYAKAFFFAVALPVRAA